MEYLEIDRFLLQAYKLRLFKRLQELGCSAILDEVKAALQTVGPNPFEPNGKPVWAVLDSVKALGYLKCRYRAARNCAWNDIRMDITSEMADRYQDVFGLYLTWIKEKKASGL